MSNPATSVSSAPQWQRAPVPWRQARCRNWVSARMYGARQLVRGRPFLTRVELAIATCQTGPMSAVSAKQLWNVWDRQTSDNEALPSSSSSEFGQASTDGSWS